MITKTITLATTDWLKISFAETSDQNWFTCWADADIEVSQLPAPAVDQIVPVASWNTFWFEAATDFWIRGAIWVEFYIAPFDAVASSSGGSSANIIYNWASPSTTTVGAMPAWTNTFWMTLEAIIEDMTTDPANPSVQLRWTPSFALFEVWDTIVNPTIEWNGALGSAPTWVLTQLELFRGATSIFTQPNPVAWTWYWGVDTHTINIVAWTSETYTAVIDDDQARSWNISRIYEGTYPFFWTTVAIGTLTQQALRTLTSSYFSVNSVAETGGDKYKADFETAYITITGVQFYNTVASAWQRMGWSKANSLLLRNTTSVNHTIQGNLSAYTRFTHNWPVGWTLQLRFFTV